MKNKTFNIIIIVLSAVIFMSFAISTKGLGHLIGQLKNLNYFWILLSSLLMVTYWIADSIILNIFAKSLSVKQTLWESFKMTMIGQFFNSITPFYSGGQPAQVYFMMKRDINCGVASSILAMKLVVYQGVLAIYSIIIVILKFTFFKNNMSNFFCLAVLGLIINAGVILFLVLASINKRVTKGILTFILTILSKIRIVKNVNKVLLRVEEELDNFHKNSVLIIRNFGTLIWVSLFTAIQLTAYFVIPYFIYRSFNMNSADFFNMVAVGTFLNMIVTIIPLPGASGGSEGGFYMLFGMFFRRYYIVSAIIIWRIITYYFCIAFGSIFTIVEKNSGTISEVA
ncbi:lysylphosphatidylglycerol synthase transmembrane domain-containing protein [Clostridium ganghwense]|uniref:Phosphatidylglycerol lysyltransferase n=1 Tax=Clostridium ganghwense TaxID=312089 RepID=A0ABT4CJG4_9CLOT|nr:lysylphosphatidylglycerol synthase transmembrane domain-containing protein [Clostridium ganghwense]MCY6369187.1 lysylphosphatidylglycerol synthase transmembrane domain-containing protein [Clostridium ganghwense]